MPRSWNPDTVADLICGVSLLPREQPTTVKIRNSIAVLFFSAWPLLQWVSFSLCYPCMQQWRRDGTGGERERDRPQLLQAFRQAGVGGGEEKLASRFN